MARASTPAALDIVTSGGVARRAGQERRKAFVLRGDGRLTLSGAATGIFDLRAEPDLPPKIAVVGDIRVNARGSFSLAYRIEDDYGARDAKITALATDERGRALFAPPELPLDLPAAPGGLGEARATIDWSDSPYAGRKVTLRLSVQDESGQQGEALVKDFVLPQKPLRDPLARALGEQRGLLALDVGRGARRKRRWRRWISRPNFSRRNSGFISACATAPSALRHARNDDDLREVADYLWSMALQIDEGDMTQAERDLRAAEKALRDAMKNGASQGGDRAAHPRHAEGHGELSRGNGEEGAASHRRKPDRTGPFRLARGFQEVAGADEEGHAGRRHGDRPGPAGRNAVHAGKPAKRRRRLVAEVARPPDAARSRQDDARAAAIARRNRRTGARQGRAGARAFGAGGSRTGPSRARGRAKTRNRARRPARARRATRPAATTRCNAARASCATSSMRSGAGRRAWTSRPRTG